MHSVVCGDGSSGWMDGGGVCYKIKFNGIGTIYAIAVFVKRRGLRQVEDPQTHLDIRFGKRFPCHALPPGSG